MATSDRSLELARELLALLPPQYTTLKWGSGGSEAVEAAIKMARQFHRQAGDPRKYKVLSHYRGLSRGDGPRAGRERLAASRSPYEPLAAGFVHLHTPDPYRPPFDVDPAEVAATYVRLVEEVIELEGSRDDRGPDHRADPDVGGRVIPPHGYLPALRELCDRHDIVLIFDEIITGFGRTGHLFASELVSTWPDILVFGKGLTGGYIALSATVLTDGWPRRSGERRGRSSQRATRMPAIPSPARPGLAALAELRERDLVANAAAGRAGRCAACGRSRRASPGIGDVRGQGLLFGLEFVRDTETKEQFPAAENVGVKVREAARRRGLLLRASHWMAVLAPPLTTTEAELDELLDILDEALTEVLTPLAATPQPLRM